MQMFLDMFAATLMLDEHAALVIDQAGWHTAGALRIPNNISLYICHPTVRSSILSNASGSTCESATSATGCWMDTKRSSMRSAAPGGNSIQNGSAH